MAISHPNLEICCIKFKKHTSTKKKVFKIIKKTARIVIPGVLPVSEIVKYIGNDAHQLKRIIEKNNLTIIKTPQELEHYTNAEGNEWIINDSSRKKIQYYVKHPKIGSSHLLIEAQNFYDHIDEEQKNEIIEYIFAHCPAKVINIDRVVSDGASVSAKAPVKATTVEGGFTYNNNKENYYKYNNPNGAKKVEPREKYYWINESLMLSIQNLTEGATLDDIYINDFTFGLNIKEATTIGLKAEKCKKYKYSIHIEC